MKRHESDALEEDFVPPRSGSFRIIETRLPVAGVDFPRGRIELDEMFPTEQACQEYLERLRWPRGFTCSSCGLHSDPWRSGTGLLACVGCKHLCAVTHGSLFHGAAIPLRRWFRAVWEVTDRESGTSVAMIQRALELRERTAAERCLAALRTAMMLPTRRKLRGSVELAKSMVEVTKTRLGRTATHRVQVLVAVEASPADIGQVRLRHLRQVGSSEAIPFAREHIEAGTEVVTPPWFGYAPLRSAGFDHRTAVQPPGDKHPMPNVEQVAAILRLWLWSTPEVSSGTLPGYLDEFTFRFNRRWYPRGLLFYRLMILAALFDTADEELLGISANG